MVIREVEPGEIELLPALCVLLQDCVDDGASVGFLAPLSHADASDYWRGILLSLGTHLKMWIAEDDTGVVGTVQLALSPRQNGKHRAEVQKLSVLRTHRGRGIAQALMTRMESFARANGLSLLVLDTEASSGAEALYTLMGWHRVGEIPDYGARPDGVLRPTAVYYKRLGESA